MEKLEKKVVFYTIDIFFMMAAVGAILWSPSFTALSFVILALQDILQCVKSLFEENERTVLCINSISIIANSILMFFAVGVYFGKTGYIPIIKFGSLICLFRTSSLALRYMVLYLQKKLKNPAAT